MRRFGTSGATWTCRSYAPATSSLARSLGRASTAGSVAIARNPILPLRQLDRASSASSATLAFVIRGSTPSSSEQVARRLHLVDPPSGVRAAAGDQPVEKRAADDSGDLLLQPRLLLRLARCGEALERRRGEAFHEHGAEQLHRRRVSRALGDDLDRHAERPEQVGEPLCAGP